MRSNLREIPRGMIRWRLSKRNPGNRTTKHQELNTMARKRIS